MKKVIVFSGAGMSAESGIKTFRDTGGLWENYSVEEVATPGAWKKDPALVLQFYNERRRNIADAVPNAAHSFLAELELAFHVQIITQNIDDLHERAGSSKVMHLHGEIFKKRSENDPYLIEEVWGDMGMDDKAKDGGRWRPHIVWFGEEVPMMANAVKKVKEADIFIVIGTSLQVYPAASLLNYVHSAVPIVLIDKQIPEFNRANLLCIEKPATEALSELQEILDLSS